MEDKLISKLIKKEIETRGESQLPPSIELKLDKAYEAIKSDNVNIKNEKKSNKKKYAMAASLTIGLMAIISFNPVLAEKIPVLNEISKSLKEIYWVNDNYISNASNINITQKDKGIEINLEGVIYDESSIKFIYTLSSEKKLQWGIQMNKSSLKINGKELLWDNEKYLGDEKKFSDETKISKDEDKIEKYAAVITYDISDINLEDNVEISWEPKEIHTFNGTYAKGNWKFDFKISKEALKSTSKVFNTNYVFEKYGYKKTIEKIIFTPSETKIIEKDDGKLNQDSFNARMALEKDPNNKEQRELLNKLEQIDHQLTVPNYRITDEKGNELKMLLGKGYGDLDGSRLMFVYQPVNEIPQKLTFTALDLEYDKAIEVPLKDIKTPFVFKQGENMSITVNSIENNDGKVKMNATFNGDFIAKRIVDYSISIIPKNIKDLKMIFEMEDSIAKDNLFDYYSIANKENNTFDFHFEIDPSQDYVVKFKNFYNKMSEFSVDLNK